MEASPHHQVSESAKCRREIDKTVEILRKHKHHLLIESLNAKNMGNLEPLISPPVHHLLITTRTHNMTEDTDDRTAELTVSNTLENLLSCRAQIVDAQTPSPSTIATNKPIERKVDEEQDNITRERETV